MRPSGTHLYKRVGPSVGPSVRRSVCPLRKCKNRVSRLFLATVSRVEARLPRLELAFEYHFFVKINVFEDEWYNFYTHFDHFYPGAHMF